MQSTTASWASLVGRLILGGFFLQAGVLKIFTYTGMVAFATAANLPVPEAAITTAIVIEILGGLSLILGYKMRWGASVLAFFTLVTALVFHTNFADQAQLAFFSKNIAIMGGLLFMAGTGSGRFALDK